MAAEEEDRTFDPEVEPGRMGRSEVEQRMLEAATRRVLEQGLDIGFDHIRMDDLIKEAQVPKSSAYRRWPKKEDFFADFLPTLARPLSGFNSAYDVMTQTIATSVLQRNVHRLSTRAGRIAVASEAIRQAVDRNFSVMADDGRWRAYSALVATASSARNEEIRERVSRAVREADEFFVGEMARFYDGLLPWVRARFRPRVTSTHLAAAGAAVVEGLVTRNSINPDAVQVSIPGPALDGGTTSWSLAATSFLAIVMQMVEFDSDEHDSESN